MPRRRSRSRRRRIADAGRQETLEVLKSIKDVLKDIMEVLKDIRHDAAAVKAPPIVASPGVAPPVVEPLDVTPPFVEPSDANQLTELDYLLLESVDARSQSHSEEPTPRD